MDAARFLTCSRCAGRIGAYEPLWWRRPDGAVASSSFLAVRADPLHAQPGSAFFHGDCLGADEPVVEGVAHELGP